MPTETLANEYGIIQQDDLYCDLAGSDKVFHLALVKVQGGYQAFTAFAARGAMLKPNPITDGVVDLATAKAAYADKLKAKLKKYRPTPGISGDKVFPFPKSGEAGSSSSLSEPFVEVKAVEREHSGFVPQGLNEISEEELIRLIDNPEYGFQEKMNYERLTVLSDGNGQVSGIQKQGFVRPVSVEIADAFTNIGIPCKVDGEGSNQCLYAFDLLSVDGKDYRMQSTLVRFQALEILLAGTLYPGVQVVPLYITAEDKRALYERVKAENLEGICAKRLDAPSSDGKPASGGDWFKWKFVKTLSAIVIGRNGSKRSVSVGVYTDDSPFKELKPIGNPKVHSNQDIPADNSIVEVRYLTMAKGGLLVQPHLVGPRTDVDASECVESQIRYN